MTGSFTERSKKKVVKLAEQRYELLARTGGQTAIVWKARLIGENEVVPDSSMVDYEFLEKGNLDQDIAGSEEDRIAPDDLVALKIPLNDSQGEGLLEEGKRLALLKTRNVPGIVKLKYDYFARGYPCLALAWAQGQKLSEFKPDNPERVGLTIAAKLVAVIRATFNAGIYLTDTMKPDSVFWDPESQTVTLIDFGIVGTLLDTESKTMPYFGNTLHQVFTGKQPMTDFASGLDFPERFGEPHQRWSALSGGTRRIIRRLFTDKYLDVPIERVAPRDQYDALRQALGRMEDDILAQSANWDIPESRLRSELRKAHGADAVNLLDILRVREGRSGSGLTPDEEAILREAWQQVARDELAGRERARVDYRAAQREMAVAHDLYKADANIHRTYLLLEAAGNAPAGPAWWQDAAPVIEQMERGDNLAAGNDCAAAAEAYEQAAKDAGDDLPPWLRAETTYLADWARVRAELASKPWDAREPAVSDREKRLKNLAEKLDRLRQNTPWPEFRERYQGEYTSLVAQTNDLNREAQAALAELNKMLADGKITDAERRLNPLEERFLLETGDIKRALRHGHATTSALREVRAAKTAAARKSALDSALRVFEEVKDIAASAGTKSERAELVHLTIQFLLGRAALDRYTEALELVEQLQKVAKADLPAEIDDFKKMWRSKSDLQGRYFSKDSTPEGTEELERAIEAGFFFAPNLSDLNSVLASKYEKDYRLYAAKRKYESVPDVEMVIARVTKLDPSPWLAAKEEEDLRNNKKKAENSARKLTEQIQRLRRDFLTHDLERVGDQSDSDLIIRAGLLSAPDSDGEARSKLTDVLLDRAADTAAADKALFYLGLAEPIAPEVYRARLSKAQGDRLDELRKDDKRSLEKQLDEERRRINEQFFDQLRIEQAVGNLTILLRQAQTLTPATGSDTAWDNLARLLDDLQKRVAEIDNQRANDSDWRDYRTKTLEPQLRDIRGAVAAYEAMRSPQVVADIAAGKIAPEPAQPVDEPKPLSEKDYDERLKLVQKVKEPANVINYIQSKDYQKANGIVNDISKAEFARLRGLQDHGADSNDSPQEQGEG